MSKSFAARALNLIERLPGPERRDIHQPIFPEKERMVAAFKVVYLGWPNDYDAIYLVWRTAEKKVKYREVVNLGESNYFLGIRGLKIVNQNLVVSIAAGSNTLKPWQKDFSFPLAEFELKK